ncbi:MAG: ABC transporter substrate-binding protein [Hyphomicrobiaceae bacterium]|nr:ABC transporter substrate-binding protein [Hyphomicrobiaceae bacterium]
MLGETGLWRRTKLGVLALAAGCGLAAVTAEARADGEIVLAAPMTGAYASTGAAMREAAEGRLAGSLPLVIEDDRCEAQAAVEAARRIAAAKPAVVIGHPCSSAAIAAAPIYAAAQIPFIATGARHGDLTDKRAGPLVFRLAGRDDRQGKDAAAFLARASGGRPIAILHDRTFAMSTIAQDAATALTGPAGQPPEHKVMQFPYVASELNYDPLVEKVVAFSGGPNGLGAILFAGFPSEAIIVLKSLRARGVTAPFLGANAVATNEIGAALATRLGDVFVLLSADDAKTVVLLTATACAMWQTAGTAADPGVALAGIAFDDPALGRITFDAKGDADVPSYLVSAWRDGAWKPAAAPEAEKIPLP